MQFDKRDAEDHAHLFKGKDPRECGFNGCGHPKCDEACQGISIEDWNAWAEKATYPEFKHEGYLPEEVLMMIEDMYGG